MSKENSNKILVIIITFIILSITIIIIPFWIYFFNHMGQKKKSHCNNNITTGIIISIEKLQTGTILTLENKGTMKKEAVDNYYYDIYQVNDSIVHCK